MRANGRFGVGGEKNSREPAHGGKKDGWKLHRRREAGRSERRAGIPCRCAVARMSDDLNTDEAPLSLLVSVNDMLVRAKQRDQQLAVP